MLIIFFVIFFTIISLIFIIGLNNKNKQIPEKIHKIVYYICLSSSTLFYFPLDVIRAGTLLCLSPRNINVIIDDD
jgi:hypothetical protein